MSQKWKKSENCEGSVKIVGINHGLCLQKFLERDGWKDERFTVSYSIFLLVYYTFLNEEHVG